MYMFDILVLVAAIFDRCEGYRRAKLLVHLAEDGPNGVDVDFIRAQTPAMCSVYAYCPGPWDRITIWSATKSWLSALKNWRFLFAFVVLLSCIQIENRWLGPGQFIHLQFIEAYCDDS
jgi:hypothetical protein